MDVPEYSAEMREAGFIWHPFARTWRGHREGHANWEYMHIFEDDGWVAVLVGSDGLDTRNKPKFPTPMAALVYAELMNWGRDAHNPRNTLDDYEEGAWAPAIKTTGSADVEYVVQQGRYTKVGSTVYVNGLLVPTLGGR